MLSKKLLDELMWSYDSKESKVYQFHSEIQQNINSNLHNGFNSFAKTNIAREKPVDIIL